MIRTVCSLTLFAMLLSAAEARAGAWSIGPAEPHTVKGEYNWATGELMISVNQVMNWTYVSQGLFTGPDVSGVKQILPLGGDWNLVSASRNTIGEGGYAGAFTYTDVYLGRVVEPGTDVDDFYLESIDRFGGQIYKAEISAIPEPSALAALTAGAVGLATFAWKRRRRVATTRR